MQRPKFNKMELHHRYLPCKLLRFLKVILNDVVQKFISTDKQIFKISNKVTSTVLIDAFMIIYRSSHRGVLLQKVSLEISQNSQENTCARVFILIKLGLQLY